MLTLYDAARCPYCARVRIVLAEKRLSYDAVEIDLSRRPAWLYEKNRTGKVPVLEEDGGLVLPESAVIAEYLDERFPDPALLPLDPAERALARLRIFRFDDFGDEYYAVRRGEEEARPRLESRLRELDGALARTPYLGGREYGLADIAYVPWILRLPALLDLELEPYDFVVEWRERLLAREAVRAEAELVEGLLARR